MNELESTAVVDWLHTAAPHCATRRLCLRRGPAGTGRTARWAPGSDPLAASGNPENPLSCRSTLRAARSMFRLAPSGRSGGVSSGFDLTLALVEDDYGFTLARNVAQDMVMACIGLAVSYSSAAIIWSSPARADRSANCKAGSPDPHRRFVRRRAGRTGRRRARLFTACSRVTWALRPVMSPARTAAPTTSGADPDRGVIAEKSGFGTSISLRRVLKSDFISRRANTARKRFPSRRMA